MSWLGALPRAFMALRSSISQATGFTPYELATGRQSSRPSSGLGFYTEETFLTPKCFNELKALVTAFSKLVKEKAVEPTSSTLQQEWVLLKVFKRKSLERGQLVVFV